MGKATADERELALALEESNDKLKEMEGLLNKLSKPPLTYGSVLGVGVNGTYTVSEGGGVYEVQCLPSIKPEIGSVVMLSPMKIIVGEVDLPTEQGIIGTVESVVDDGKYVRTTIEGRQALIIKPKHLLVDDGDQIVIRDHVVIKNLGKRIEVQDEVTDIQWDDIGGLEHQKAEIQEVIELPFTHRELFLKYKKKFSKGVLLYGPPGNGKTLLGKAAATSLAKMFGKATSTGFIYIKGPELLNPYVGVTEANIRNLFKRAKKHYEEHKYPAIIFIDEADSLLRRRGSGRSSDVEITTVATFLAETDGLGESNTMLFITTNRPDAIDKAILREGRVDKKIKVPTPSPDTACRIFEVHLRGKPICGDKDIREMAMAATQEIVSRFENGLAEHISGAMIADLVEQATIHAIKREINNSNSSGIALEDIQTAVALKIQSINHMLEGTDGD